MALTPPFNVFRDPLYLPISMMMMKKAKATEEERSQFLTLPSSSVALPPPLQIKSIETEEEEEEKAPRVHIIKTEEEEAPRGHAMEPLFFVLKGHAMESVGADFLLAVDKLKGQIFDLKSYVAELEAKITNLGKFPRSMKEFWTEGDVLALLELLTEAVTGVYESVVDVGRLSTKLEVVEIDLDHLKPEQKDEGPVVFKDQVTQALAVLKNGNKFVRKLYGLVRASSEKVGYLPHVEKLLDLIMEMTAAIKEISGLPA